MEQVPTSTQWDKSGTRGFFFGGGPQNLAKNDAPYIMIFTATVFYHLLSM